MKACIFHFPAPLQEKAGVGSALRPFQMMKAFGELGYQVDVVAGYSKERSRKIKEIKEKIKKGKVYDFVYAENVNDPFMFSDADHLPRRPFMDRAFFKFCKGHNIPVGMFYRDVYWKFPVFKESTNLLQRIFLTLGYSLEEKRFAKCLNLLFLPTERMHKYVLPHFPAKPLPPGGVLCEEILREKQNRVPVKDGILRVFYVGSLSSLYDNKYLFEAVKNTPNVELTVCTHKGQWESVREEYAPLLCDRIHIVHQSGDQLIARYLEADLSAYCLKKCEYLDFAMPIKVFEAIRFGTPLLVADIHSIGQLVEGEGLGWNTENNPESIGKTLAFLRENPGEVAEKTANVVKAVPNHTWLARARRAAEELGKLKQ